MIVINCLLLVSSNRRVRSWTVGEGMAYPAPLICQCLYQPLHYLHGLLFSQDSARHTYLPVLTAS